MVRLLQCVLAVTTLSATIATADPANVYKAREGYLYFNRPHASKADHDSELKNCVATWRGGVVINITGGGEPLIDGMVHGLMMSAWEKARFAVNVEHCMVVRGWRVVRLADGEGRQLARLGRGELSERLRPWISAAEPHGEIVRVWANEAARQDTNMVRSPQGAKQTQLSMLSMDTAAPDPVRRIESESFPWTNRISTLKPLSPAEILNPPADLAIIIVKISPTSNQRGPRLSFDLKDGVGGKLGTEDLFEMSSPHSTPNVQAYAVPAGRWRISSYSALFDYCLGSPSVRIKAGEVVYFGDFKFGPNGMTADMTTAPAVSYLSSNPALSARVHPANWVNGETHVCRLWHPYAFELDGFPYESGYEWGGAYKATKMQ